MKSRTLMFLFVLLTSTLLAEEPPKTVKLILSPETTYLTEPRLPDGRIDYLAALNKELAARTTPENNILVGICSIVAGEMEIPLLLAGEKMEKQPEFESVQKYRQQFWKMIGLDAPSPLNSLVDCKPVISTKDYEKELLEFYSKEELASMLADVKTRKIEMKTSEYYREIVYDQWIETLKRPWTAKEFPYLAKWIETTDSWAPKLIHFCRQRTGYYHPLISNTPLLYGARLPYPQSFRSVTRMLETRGNLKFAQGKVDQAMDSALASVRMGQTMRKGSGWIIEELIGLALDGCGNRQLTTYLADLPKEKDAAWILQWKKEYDDIETKIGLPPLPSAWCLLERFGTLSAVQMIAVEPKTALEFFKKSFEGETEILAKYEKLFNSCTEYDWNDILKQVNLFYDDLEDVCLIPNCERRFRAADRLERRVVEYGKRNINSSENPERQAVDFLLGNFSPSIGSVMIALSRAEWDMKITSVAFALAAYRSEHGGENPETLEQLVPKYLDKIPESPFTEKPLRYLKRQHDVLIPNDDEYKLDGSEPDVEQKIAEEKSGGRAFPTARHFIFVVQKTK